MKYIIRSAILLLCTTSLVKPAKAENYPFILRTDPLICKKCSTPKETLHQKLLQKLISSGVFTDNFSYMPPEGAKNPPAVSKLTRTLTLVIEEQKRVHFNELTPYLKERVEHITFTVKAALSASPSTEECSAKVENISSLKLEDAIDSLASSLIECHAAKRIPIEFESPFSLSLVSINLSAMHIKPRTKFKEYASSATGANLTAYFSNSIIPSLLVFPSLSWYKLNDPVDSIASWQSVLVMANAGFSFKLPLRLAVIPFAGGGYIVHRISGDRDHHYPPYEYAPSWHFNPQISAGSSLLFALDPALSIIASTSYDIFFTKSSRFDNISYSLGFAFTCDLPVYRKVVRR